MTLKQIYLLVSGTIIGIFLIGCATVPYNKFRPKLSLQQAERLDTSKLKGLTLNQVRSISIGANVITYGVWRDTYTVNFKAMIPLLKL